MSRPSVPHFCPNCHERVLLSPEPANNAPMIGTAKAAEITGAAQKTVSTWCKKGDIPGARRDSGYQTKWLLPRAWCLAYAERRRREQRNN